MVACQWNMSSPTGPAEQFDGGSLPRSTSSCSGQLVSYMAVRWEGSRKSVRRVYACRIGKFSPRNWKRGTRNFNCTVIRFGSTLHACPFWVEQPNSHSSTTPTNKPGLATPWMNDRPFNADATVRAALSTHTESTKRTLLIRFNDILCVLLCVYIRVCGCVG